MSAVALVPARNEADRIDATVRGLAAVDAIDEIIVVDDASTDATASTAAAAGARVHRLARRRGKGGALRAGLTGFDADIALLIDADLGSSATHVARVLLDTTTTETADMVIAAPPPGSPSGFGLVEGLGRWGIRRCTGTRLRRPLSGQRALRRRVVEAVALAPGFGVDVALTIDAIRAGFRVIEVTVPVDHARTGRTVAGFSHRARQGADVLRAIVPRLLGLGGPR